MKHSAPMTKSLTQPVKRKLEPQSSSELDLGDSSRIQADSETGRDTKRSRLSISSTLLGALRGGTHSLANLLGDVEETPTDAELKKLKELTEQRRSSLIRGKGKSPSYHTRV